jgi:hypothetical protein
LNKATIIILGFVITLIIHFLWVSQDLEPNSVWADSIELSEQPQLSGYELYLKDGEYFLGLSFAIAIAFSVFAISRINTDKKKGVMGVLGGTSLSAGLYAFGCFLVGCCGSPMIVIYAGLFGSSFLGFTKPLVFVVTALSIAFAYWRLTRIAKGECCSTENTKH